MAFDNRAQAARLLAARLDKYRSRHPVVLAIPRGAVPMGRILADALDGDLDVVLVRKLRAPHNPELAIGSIDELGATYVYPDTRDLWTDRYLETEKAEQMKMLAWRRNLYGQTRPPIEVTGRVAIVLDDGIATGSTMIAALRAVRARQPARLIAATAVAPGDTLLRIRREADEIVCLETPEFMFAIGNHFRDFSQVSDEEVVAALSKPRAAAAGR
ncbi:MAG TPA: phosphoribosyltransferase family protein [Vicinamibacterales bacterium]|nr:phosphoribosyltransferase family protein [Vicinamibacterales bacterium]